MLESKWSALQEIIIKMSEVKYRDRPTCAEVLSQFDSWDISIEEVKQSDGYEKIVNNMKEFSNKFFNNYFEFKSGSFKPQPLKK